MCSWTEKTPGVYQLAENTDQIYPPDELDHFLKVQAEANRKRLRDFFKTQGLSDQQADKKADKGVILMAEWGWSIYQVMAGLGSNTEKEVVSAI